jgi:hypothetical protein
LKADYSCVLIAAKSKVKTLPVFHFVSPSSLAGKISLSLLLPKRRHEYLWPDVQTLSGFVLGMEEAGIGQSYQAGDVDLRWHARCRPLFSMFLFGEHGPQ